MVLTFPWGNGLAAEDEERAAGAGGAELAESIDSGRRAQVAALRLRATPADERGFHG